MTDEKPDPPPIDRKERIRRMVRDALYFTGIAFGTALEFAGSAFLVIVMVVGLWSIIVNNIATPGTPSSLLVVEAALGIIGFVVVAFLALKLVAVIRAKVLPFLQWLFGPDVPSTKTTIVDALSAKVKALNEQIAALEREQERLGTVVALQEKNAEISQVLTIIRRHPDVADVIDSALKKRAAQSSRRVAALSLAFNVAFLIFGWVLSGFLCPVQLWRLIHP